MMVKTQFITRGLVGGSFLMSHRFVVFVMCCVFCFTLFSSCDYLKRNSGDDEILARVGEKVLFLSDVESVFSEFKGMNDSAEMSKLFINSWVKKQVLLSEAEIYLKGINSDFTKQLEDYKNSLMVYAYESDRADKELDTLVKAEDIETYYEENKDKFRANETLFKGLYFKVDRDSIRYIKRRINNLIGTNEELNLGEIELFCNNSTLDYVVSVKHFTPILNIVEKLPLYSIDVKNVHKQKGLVEFTGDGDVVYYLYVLDFIERGDVLPLELSMNSVKKVMLKQRRLEFLERINKQLYDKAVENGDIELF